MKPFLLFAALLAMPEVAFGAPAPQAGPEEAQRVQKEFDALLARVRTSDASVDFTQLRKLYAKSSSYVPTRDDAEQEMITAAGSGRFAEAREKAQEILARNYMNIEAHMASVVVCNALKDEACSAHHLYVARGMLDSIYGSGDGKTMTTAFVVISVPEEYALLRVLGLSRVEQVVVSGSDGTTYDVLRVRDPSNGEDGTLYFNVDASLAATRRLLGLK